MLDAELQNLRSLLDQLATLKPWARVAQPQLQPLADVFATTLAQARAAAPAYIAAVQRSPSLDLMTWVKDMTALNPWTEVGDDPNPFAEALAAARDKAIEAAGGARGGERATEGPQRGALVDEPTIDAYNDSEQAVGCFMKLEEHLEVPSSRPELRELWRPSSASTR
jgi:hypothetical protein